MGEYKMDKEETVPAVATTAAPSYIHEFNSFVLRDWIQTANEIQECESVSIRIKDRMRSKIEDEIEKLLDR